LSLQRAKLADLNLDQLADTLAGPHPGTPSHGVAMAEFTRRQTLAQLESARAQQEAAEAAKLTAQFTRRTARYMLISVIATVVLFFLNLAWGFWVHYAN
jgi:hypothetical protein